MIARPAMPRPVAGSTALPAGFAHPHASEEARLARLRDSASLPDQPDRRWVDSWLHRGYLDFWASSR